MIVVHQIPILSTYLNIYRSSYPSSYRPTNQHINLLTFTLPNLTNYQPSSHLPTHLLTHIPIHLLTHQPISGVRRRAYEEWLTKEEDRVNDAREQMLIEDVIGKLQWGLANYIFFSVLGFYFLICYGHFEMFNSRPGYIKENAYYVELFKIYQ